jgi:hypothetical protein
MGWERAIAVAKKKGRLSTPFSLITFEKDYRG